MTRAYTLKKRAESQAETRQKIVEATLDLHTRIGPARTTVTMIAEQAGVQRHTVYAHFPDERGLFQACSGLSLERDPIPDPTTWRRIADPAERLATGLAALYGWYARNADMAANVLRDAEVHELTRETVSGSIEPHVRSCRSALGEGVAEEKQILVDLAVTYFTWRTLSEAGKRDPGETAAMMTRVIICDG